MNVEASEAGSVGKTEVTGPPAVQESRWGPLPKWDAGHQGEGEIRTPQVQVGTSCIRGFGLHLGWHFLAGLRLMPRHPPASHWSQTATRLDTSQPCRRPVEGGCSSDFLNNGPREAIVHREFCSRSAAEGVTSPHSTALHSAGKGDFGIGHLRTIFLQCCVTAAL